ncbi:MAG: class I SAM-dependent methyltransferase [Treponema sp.]|nr:class I SAM-dependent methyltransferase [Treponema sp.]
MDSYAELNAQAIDRWVGKGWIWGIPMGPEEFARAKAGDWKVLLTPLKPVPQEWFLPFLKEGSLKGTRLLGLASGGGQQMPVFSALGAECTVLDYSERQLESERLVAQREAYDITLVRADMTKPLPFPDGSFDLIFHPVSNCYIEDVNHVWRECMRILRSGGVLLAGMGNGVSYLFDDEDPLRVVHKLPYNPLKNPELYKKSMEDPEDGSIQFSHTLEDQLGGQLRAGLTLRDLYEDFDTEGVGEYYPTFWASRAVKP